MTVRQRIIAGTAATLTWRPVDQDGEPSDPGTTTVAVTRSDGSTVHAAGTATSGSGTSRTVALTLAQNALPDRYTATWTGAAATGTTTTDAAGAVYFGVQELRDRETSVASEETYPTTTVQEMRRVVEDKFERTGVVFVPRFQVVTPSNGVVSMAGVRSIRWVQLDDEDETVVTTNLDDYAEVFPQHVQVLSSSVLRMGVERGMDAPPSEVRRAAMRYCRHLLTGTSPGVDYRPLSTVNPDGSRDQYATPGVANWRTGIPEIDEVLMDYAAPSRRRVGTIHTAPWVRS